MKGSLLLAILGAGLPPLQGGDLPGAVERLRPHLVELRRDFHAHPELSEQEVRTSRVVADRLRALGLEVKTGVGGHGVVALLKGGRPGPVVALRADMDALPIQEASDVPYRSRTDGIMHACGHDVHMTVALGTAEVLCGMRKDLPGTVKFLFQPAEEIERSGAARMIREGALADPRPEVIFGLHVMPGIEAGEVGYVRKGAMAASDAVTATLRGRMAHGASPDKGVDAIVLASECVQALQTLRSRRVDPLRPMVLTFGTIQGGVRRNIIADTVILEGTLRTLDEATRAQVKKEAREILAGLAAAHGGSFELAFTPTTPLLTNEPALVDLCLPSLQKALGEGKVHPVDPWMGSEDFAYYLEEVPGFFCFLGVGNRARGLTASVHHPRFDVDEACLEAGVKAMTRIVVDYLERKAPRK